MEKRLALHEKLCSILGSRNAYFQPPTNIKLQYPCIIYKRKRIDTRKADNLKYLMYDCYDVTLITKDPDSPLPKRLLGSFDHISLSNHTTIDNLHHDYYTLFD